jgi:tRNA-2-methylthio-N6-dimethylallyladenosine synthase
MAKKYVIETFGCQMNVHDSERMSGLLEAEGYEPAPSADTADLVVINTCSVREKAEEKLFTRLGELRVMGDEQGRRPVVAVAGCVAQQEGSDLLKRSKLVDVLIGTQAVKQLPGLVARAEQGTRHPLVDLNPYEDVSFPFGVTRRDDPLKAYVTIIEGCNDFCAFCVVPYTRGHERMRPLAEILDEVRHAAATGCREVQLLGQIVNHYSAPDTDCDFARLLELVSDIDGIARIRFASPHPRHVTRRLIEAIRDLPKVCRHLHLPVQSGSTKILASMRRRYTRERYLELIAEARETVPDIALSTDMIVGFPGETDADFEDTLSLTRIARYHSMYSFKYSPRPKTLAGKRLLDDVSEPEKTRRIVALQQLQKEIQAALYEAAVGSTQQVLVDGVSRRRDTELAGRTSGNTIVNFPGDPAWLGRLIDVQITGAGSYSLKGTVSPGETVLLAQLAASQLQAVAGPAAGDSYAD